MQPGLYIEVRAGLCNRMRALDSAIFLARDIGKPLHLVWTVDYEMGCGFEELFEIPEPIASIRTISGNQLGGQKMSEELERLRGEAGYLLFQDNMFQLKKSRFNFRKLRKEQVPYISTWDRFYPQKNFGKKSPRSLGFWLRNLSLALSARLHHLYAGQDPLSPYAHLYAAFRPVAQLQERILKNTGSFQRTIGVHLRRTDNPGQRFSPTELFIRRMTQEVERHPETDFFVATDDPAEEAVLLQEFPGRIRTHKKRSLDRATKEAMEDAVIDLYCLAATERIIGTIQSSFTVTAAQINRIPLEVLSIRNKA